MKPSFWVAILYFSATAAFALPAKFLAPDSTGRPQIQIIATGQYYLFRAADAYDGSCDLRWYTTVVDANSKTWCRTTAAYPQNAVITDTVPLDAVAENSPAEFEYMVGTSADISSATYIGWAPQIAVTDTDPVATWLQKINTQYGTSIARSDIPDATAAAGNKNSISVTYGGANHLWVVYYNNKYIALFNDNGALMGVTHRTYGMEFTNFANRLPQNSYAYLINIPYNNQYGQTTMGSSTVFTSTIASDGSLVQDWPNNFGNGFHVTVTWNLKSASDAVSSSGLNGKISVVTSGTSINYVSFPFVYGLSYGVGKQIVVPRQNSGKVFPSPSDTSSSAYGTSGEYPSGDWQAQFFSIKDGSYSLYMAAEDPQQSPKNFHAYPVNSGAAGYNDFYHFPLDGTANVVTSYSVVLAPMVGGWEKAAKKYQYWALKQLWSSSGTAPLSAIASRPVSVRLKAGSFWWTSYYSGGDVQGLPYRQRPTSFLNHSNVQKNLIGPNSSGGNVRAAFHVYNWWDNGPDTNFPLYVANQDMPPTSQTWPTSINSVQSDGSLLALYINATLTDVGNAPTSDIPTYDNISIRDSTHCPVDSTSGNGWWNKDYPTGSGNMLVDSMLIRSNSVPYVACFSSQRLFALMDPFASYWQTVNNNNVSTVFGLGSGGIYLDSFAAANANRDSYNDPQKSGHAKGYGDWYRAGFRQMGTKTVQNGFDNEQGNPIFNESGVRRFILSEYFSEATNPYVDVVMNYEDARPTDQPVLQNIYNQYQMMVGQRPLVDSDPVRKAIFGRSLVWGYQLGPVETYLICPSGNCSSASSQSVLNYVRVLERTRESLSQTNVGLDWNAARFIGLADDTANTFNYSGANDWCSISDSSKACPASLPPVRGALWSSSGTNAADFLVLTNTTENAVTSSIPVPKAWSSASLVYQSTSGPDSYVTPFNNAASINMPANSVAVYKATLSTVKANQYISVTTSPPSNATYGTEFSVAASSSSGLSITVSTSGGCTNSGNTVTMTSGTTACTVMFDQVGDASYSAASRTVSSSVAAVKANQSITITSAAPVSAIYGSNFTVVASVNSGLAVAISTSGGCTNSGNTVTMTSASTPCTVNYNQAGDANYNAASQVSSNTAASKASQSISVTQAAPASAGYGSKFTVAATASSSLPVSFTVSGGCSISGSTVTMTSTSTACMVKYNQAGNSNYNAAAQVSSTTSATKANQTISSNQPSTFTRNTNMTVTATATSGLSVTIAKSSGSCTKVSGGTGSAVFKMGGLNTTCTLKYAQNGNTNYNAATNNNLTIKTTAN